MPRIDPTVTEEAQVIYDKWKRGERGQKVSRAIIEYDNKDTQSLVSRIEELERKVKELEGKKNE